jgi:Methylamine utilisation protein MauE
MRMAMLILSDPVITIATSLGLVTLLFGAAVHKWRNPEQFSAVLATYDILPDRFAPAVRRGIPLLEASLAIGLLIPSTRPYSALLTSVLLLAYAAAMGWTLVQGQRVADCGCGLGNVSQRVSAALVWRNLVLALLAGNLLLTPSVRDITAYDWGAILFSTLAGGAFYMLNNTLIATQNSARDLFHD